MSRADPGTYLPPYGNWALFQQELISRRKCWRRQKRCSLIFHFFKVMLRRCRLTMRATDRVLVNFGLLHLAQPENACREAFRVLKQTGKVGFTVWAAPPENLGGKIVNDAVEAHADPNVQLPQGPPHYLYDEREECRKVLEQTGFDSISMMYETRSVEWHIPTARYLFEAERDAGVRTAGLLTRQSPERLSAIRMAIEDEVSRYARGNEFVIPMAAHLVVAAKPQK